MRQGTQHVLGTRQRADDQGARVNQAGDTDSPECLAGTRAAVQRAQQQRCKNEQQHPQDHGDVAGDDAFQEPDCHTQHDDAETLFDLLHPGADPGQQRPGGCADDKQRHAEAQPHGEQRRTAQQRITGLADIQQRPGQGRGDTGADDDCGHRAHERAGIQAAAVPGLRQGRQPGLHGGRHAQFIKAEHGQGQEDEHQAERADHPYVLGGGLQVYLEGAGQHAQQGVGQRHGEHVGQGQQEPAPGGHGSGLADDDAGQDGDHREHARGQREQRAEGEERQHVQDETALFQARSDPVLDRKPALADGLQGSGNSLPKTYFDLLLLRRIAHRSFLASLVSHLEQGFGDARPGTQQRCFDRDESGVHFHLAEGFILLDLAARHLHGRAVDSYAVRQ